ncbi:MAG: hypothetical protein RR749_09450 [Comamonas sp.]
MNSNIFACFQFTFQDASSPNAHRALPGMQAGCPHWPIRQLASLSNHALNGSEFACSENILKINQNLQQRETPGITGRFSSGKTPRVSPTHGNSSLCRLV